MTEFSFDLSGLSPWLRQEAVRHLEQTYHMNFGGQERITANFFRVPVAECTDRTLPAVVLRDLTAGFRDGGPLRVRAGGLGRVERARVSALLEQTAARPSREGQDELGRSLERLWREWDRQFKVPAGEYERAELVAYNGQVHGPRGQPARVVGA